MRILVFEPLKEPYVKDIEDDIQAMQEVVGGSIEPIYLVGNTLVHGTFYISGNCLNEYGEWDSCSLTDEQIEKYKEQFGHMLVDLPGIGLVAVKETKPEVIGPLEEFDEGPELII